VPWLRTFNKYHRVRFNVMKDLSPAPPDASQAAMGFSAWVRQAVEWTDQDAGLPSGLESIHLTLNRNRLANFLDHFSDDSDLKDFLILDLLAAGIDAGISSTGELEEVPDLSIRPFRLWEYIWLFKTLRLSEGGRSVLDLGGPASHIVISAAFAGNRVHSLDLNPRIVEAGRRCATTFHLENYRAEVGDMRDLSAIAPDSVDRIVCCSVLEHLTGEDQKKALSEMARVLAPGGVIGLTFDYGTAAPGANAHLPPPHEPPHNAEEVRRRYVHSGLEILGDVRLEDPIPGSLFRSQGVSYTIGALFLGKPPLQQPPLAAVLHRDRSLIPLIRIPDLVIRLSEKAHRDLSRLHLARVHQQAAEERLTALEEADSELQRLYSELKLRNSSEA
jgi:SAM-dependent methyltransferase